MISFPNEALPARSRPEANAETLLLEPLLAGLDSIAQGVALIDAASRLMYVSASARTILARSGWSIQQGELRSSRPDEHEAWLQAVRRACLREQRQLFELSLATGSYFAAIIPLAIGGRRWAFVSYGREEMCGALELQMFASRHGLTYAEAEVLRKLATGSRPAEIAAAHGVAVSTILTQIASLRSKTLAASVRDLLSTLSRLPPLRTVFTSLESSTT